MITINVTEINITPLRINNGHCGFASFVLNNQFFIGNLGIYTAPNTPSGFRLTFPNKVLASGKTVDCFFPISREASDVVSEAVITKYLDVMGYLLDKDLSVAHCVLCQKPIRSAEGFGQSGFNKSPKYYCENCSSENVRTSPCTINSGNK